MRLAVEGRTWTALVVAGLLIISVLMMIQFSSLTPQGAGPPTNLPGGGGQGNNTTSNNFGGRLVARFLLLQTPSSAATPIRGLAVEVDSNTTGGTIKPKSTHLQTNANGYAFADLVGGPYILSVFEQGWSLIGSFDISEGRTTDFNASVVGVTIPVSAYDIQDPDSSSMLGPWATMSVSLPRNASLSVNQTAYFQTNGPPVWLQIDGPLYINVRNGTTQFPPLITSNSGGPSTSAALVIGIYPYSSGQWVTLQPLSTMPISQFYQTSLLVYKATYKAGVEAL
jgi:hypothetical protein